MVVMAPPLAGAESARHLAEVLRLDRDAQGFFAADHERLRSYASRIEGIYIAGSSQGPKDIEEAASHGAAAAGELVAALVPGRKLEIDAARAVVDPDRCTGCRICLTVCPYKAISFDVSGRVAAVNDLLCRGCGTCASACASQAVSARHATDGQILAEIKALLT
jgi:heterodisulfide reductase subunit A